MATLSTKLGALVRGLKMERVRGCVLRGGADGFGAAGGSWVVLSSASSWAGESGAFFLRDGLRRSSPWGFAMDILL